jgi:hypothetical protein
MSHIKADFVGELIQDRLAVTGFHGTETCTVYKGTIKWRIEDDEGILHDILIPESYYVPNGKHRLLNPQHRAQRTSGDNTVGMSCLTLHDEVILRWNGGQSTKTVPVDAQNVFTFDLAPGYRRFSVFCMQAQYDPTFSDQTPEIAQKSLGLLKVTSATSTRLVTSEPAWLTK